MTSKLAVIVLFLVTVLFAAGAGVTHAHDLPLMTFVYLAFALLFAILSVIGGFFDD